jgi:hypothetical protein
MSAGGDLPSAMHYSSRRTGNELLTAADTEWLLAGREAHPEAPAVQHTLARLLGNAAGPPTDQELAGEVAAVAAFMLVTGHRGARHARSRNRFRVLPRVRAVAAAVGAGIVVAFSGAAAANTLPAPIQELAHRTFDAPAPHHAILAPKVPASSSAHGHGGGPDPEASPDPSAQGHRGKAKVIGKKSPSGSVHGKAKGNERTASRQKT